MGDMNIVREGSMGDMNVVRACEGSMGDMNFPTSGFLKDSEELWRLKDNLFIFVKREGEGSSGEDGGSLRSMGFYAFGCVRV